MSLVEFFFFFFFFELLSPPHFLGSSKAFKAFLNRGNSRMLRKKEDGVGVERLGGGVFYRSSHVFCMTYYCMMYSKSFLLR